MPPFRLLIRAYPRPFRDRYERELLAFLADDWRGAAARGGPLWRVRFWVRAGLDAVAAGVRLRVSPRAGGPVERRGGMGAVASEMKLALRGFRRAPGYHGLAVLTVALGVAAATAVFGVLDGVVLRPLPYPESERLVRVATDLRMNPGHPGPMSHAAVSALAEQARTLEAVAAIEVRTRVLHGPEGPALAEVAAAGPRLLELLGARPAAGRLFGEADHRPGAPKQVVLSSSTWRSEYGADPSVIGRTLRFDDEVREVIGVLDRSFVAPEAVAETAVEYWTNLSIDPAAKGSFGASSIGRLHPGATLEQAAVEATGILQTLYGEEGTAAFVQGAVVLDLREATIGRVGSALWLVLGGVGLLLAIACANVANLMLARGTDRRGEMVLRTVLGASRMRLLAHVLAQSLAVAAAGALAGVALSAAALAAFRRWAPGGIPRLAEVTLDARVLAFAILVSALAGLLFGLLPALQATRRAPAEVLRDGGRTATAGRGARGALVVAETAMALVLVLVAGLLVNGFVRLRSVDPGYDAEGLVALQVEWRGRDVLATTAYYDRLLEGVRAVPGVESAALSTFAPHLGFSVVQRYALEAASGREEPFLPTLIVSDAWLTTVGARIVAGRDFDSRDREGSEPAILVTESLARHFWPGETDIVGRRIKSGGFDVEDEGWYTIVGVVSDFHDRVDREPVEAIFRPVEQEPWVRFSVLFRVAGDQAAVLPGVRRAVAEVEEGVPVRTLSPATELASESLAQPRFYTTLVAGFGTVALLLALIGIYGTTAYATSRRTREIGVRIALGGAPSTVAGLLVREGVRNALLGVALGLVAALVGARLLQAWLFGVQPTDPLTFATTGAAVLITAALAAWVPARRAARLDPSTALRSDATGGAP